MHINIVGVLLAAGFSRRFGSNKLLYRLPDGRPMVLAAAQQLRAVFPTVVAVIRPDQATLQEMLVGEGLHVVTCLRDAQHMSASLKTAITYADRFVPSSYVIALGDMPFIQTETIRQVAKKLHIAKIVVPTYQGKRGHPVGIAAEFYTQLLQIEGDEGARSVVAAHQELVMLMTCVDPGILRDIDRLADIENI